MTDTWMERWNAARCVSLVKTVVTVSVLNEPSLALKAPVTTMYVGHSRNSGHEHRERHARRGTA